MLINSNHTIKRPGTNVLVTKINNNVTPMVSSNTSSSQIITWASKDSSLKCTVVVAVNYTAIIIVIIQWVSINIKWIGDIVKTWLASRINNHRIIFMVLTSECKRLRSLLKVFLNLNDICLVGCLAISGTHIISISKFKICQLREASMHLVWTTLSHTVSQTCISSIINSSNSYSS